jgi:hypothetical protein
MFQNGILRGAWGEVRRGSLPCKEPEPGCQCSPSPHKIQFSERWKHFCLGIVEWRPTMLASHPCPRTTLRESECQDPDAKPPAKTSCKWGAPHIAQARCRGQMQNAFCLLAGHLGQRSLDARERTSEEGLDSTLSALLTGPLARVSPPSAHYSHL